MLCLFIKAQFMYLVYSSVYLLQTNYMIHLVNVFDFKASFSLTGWE
jgi:hypothetical protein